METTTNNPEKLHVIWTTADREVALKMVFMYTLNGKKKGWWKEVALVVWGPSAKLLLGDDELKEKIKRMADEGIELLACKACTDMYGVSDELEAMGIKVMYMGIPLTEWIKSKENIITF